MQFSPHDIDKRAREIWNLRYVYKTENDLNKEKCYVLDMFPYPSGSGLHVGHPLGYVASDIYARYKRMKGFNVLHPMGFDSFGLPAEQYAIETGKMPQETTEENIKVYKEQLEKIGLSFDWSRQVITSDPSYYKWTQWIFLEMFNSYYCLESQKAEPISRLISKFESHGSRESLAYTNETIQHFESEDWIRYSEKEKADILMKFRLAYVSHGEVNWCEALGTVLANDEVINGRSERGNHPVVKKKMRQWSLRITAYAERLLRNLDGLRFPDSLKEQQRNWIGKSKGANLWFDIEGREDKLEVFSTRPDTIFGASFMVLAPDHPLVDIISSIELKPSIEDYRSYCKSKSDLDRQTNKEVTGQFIGAFCIHPFTGSKLPIYIAEYVFLGYGTGAIMAVPAEDERDMKFAEKFNLPILPIYDKSHLKSSELGDKQGVLINSDFINGMDCEAGFSAVVDYLIKSKKANYTTQYRLRDANFSRQRYWGEPIPILWKDEIPTPLKLEDLPLENAIVDEVKPTADGKAPQARNSKWVTEISGYEREVDTMPGFAGSSWYFLRYMDPNNDAEAFDKKLATYWNQVDVYIGGAEHAVGHLMYSRFYTMFLYDRGFLSFEEPYNRLINQGMIQGRSQFVYRSNQDPNLFISKNLISDFSQVTAIHVHVKFVENDLLDLEGFRSWRTDFSNAKFELEDGKYVCGWEIDKMSKRYYNVVNPDDVIAKYGADTLRMYEMFLGPLEQSKPWNPASIEGVYKFLRRFWNLYLDENGHSKLTDQKETDAEMKILHKTIEKIEQDMESFSFNTSVSALMIALNEFSSHKTTSKSILTPFLKVLCPFAPHTAEAIWSQLSNSSPIVKEPFPTLDSSYLIEDSIDYPISINGKTRSKITLPTEIDENMARQAVMKDETTLKWLEEKEIKRFIFVKSRMINIVV